MVRIALPWLSRARDSQDWVAVRFRLLRAAVDLERTWQKEGRYPGDASAIDLPVDPYGYPARLHYVSLAEGRGYKLRSVGENGKDDSGIAEGHADEVFERPPRAAAATGHSPAIR